MEQSIDYQRLAQAMLLQVAQKDVSTTPNATYSHGPGGLFSPPGISRPVFSAMSLPRKGLQDLLPSRTSNERNPLYALVTGQTATVGSEPTGVCDDPPVAGLLKLCTHSFVFGRMSRMTDVIDVDRVGQVTNRGEFTDLQLMNNPLDGTAAPTIPGTGLAGAINNEVYKQTFQLGVAFKRDFAKDIYNGNPSNNTAGGGRTYYYGLDYLINTGYRDAITGQACPAADSIVYSFGNQNVTSAAAAFIRTMVGIYHNLQYIAVSTGLDPVKWAISMPWSMFYEITEVWPCAYYTYLCTNNGASGSTQFVSAAEQIALRDSMRGDMDNRTGQYLLLDGAKVPVVLDDGVPVTENGNGVFTSSIYFVPLTVTGGTPVTWMEYFNYDAANGSLDAARAMAPEGSFYTSDSGRYMWHKKPPTNFCVQLLAKTEPRLIVLTPFIAARVTDVVYAPFLPTRSPFTDSAYYVNGGRTNYVGFGPSYYSPTA
jgi:hypothetical protein